ncbi:MAG: hypothetical protein K9K93_07460 [Acholeplasmataceae bacterium]|nr:hypothetical protein [Acholeplasmataceae bacterium]
MPDIFGIEHMLYLLVSITLMILLSRWIIKMAKDEKKIILVIRIIGAVLFVAIMWNRTSIALTKGSFSGFLPGSFCGASSLFLSLGAMTLKKDSPFFHSVAFVGLYGGLTTLIYPDFIGQSDSIFYPMTISGLVHHTVMVFLVIMMFRLGFVKPMLKKWHLFPIGLSFYMIYGLVLISELGYGDAMHINTPILSGTPLNWFVLGWIVLALHGGVLYAYDTIRDRRQAKQVVTVEPR